MSHSTDPRETLLRTARTLPRDPLTTLTDRARQALLTHTAATLATNPNPHPHRLGQLAEQLSALEITSKNNVLRCGLNGRIKSFGVHYTPVDLAERVVSKALGPLTAGVSSEALLTLKVLDPAVGGGVFLLSACRFLADRLVEAWALEGRLPKDDPHQKARLAVAEKVLWGLDLDPVALSVTRDALSILCGCWGEGRKLGRLECADALSWSPDGVRFDAVIGNPPYLSGKWRPEVDASAFRLCRGQWDTYWLFVEKGAQLSAPGAAFGWVLPDALLTREETLRVRAFIRESADHLWVLHAGSVFGAAVSAVACCGWRGPGEPTMTFDDGQSVVTRGLVGPVARLDTRWPPDPRQIPASWGRLGDRVRISRGEEVGKKSLGEGDVAVLAGAGVAALYGQPSATHAMSRALLRKPPGRYAPPKVVVVKTGRRCRAAVDRVGLVTLQSVYNVHVEDGVLTPAFVCGLLNADAVHERFIAPITVGKRIFPQITQRMLRDIRLPPIPSEMVARVTELVHRLEQSNDSSAETELQTLFSTLYERAEALV